MRYSRLYGNAVDLHDGGSGVPRAAADDLHFEGSARLYASQDQAGATGEPRWKTRPPALAMYYGGRTGRFTMATARPGDLAVPVGRDFRLEKAPGRS